MTPPERKFHAALRGHLITAGCRTWHIHCQVGSTAIFSRKKGAEWVPQWCFDFVITDAEDRIQAIVELTDYTHDHPERSEVDANKAAGCERLGFPILFVRNHETTRLRDWIQELPGRAP